uniref:Dystonin n=1 Tax=Colobus angolensis palliatus TaxID=336983 RepID=A0A2K5JXK4_COLAP
LAGNFEYTEPYLLNISFLSSIHRFYQPYLYIYFFLPDERDKVQKKTFTKWINQHLMKVRKHVNDLYEDLRDGHNLISLLEVLSGDTLPREKGRMRFHRLQNVQIALDYLKRRQVKLVNIRNDDITDGNPKLTLGLIWTIILHFQISDIHVTGESEDMSAKERLLLWTQQATEGYAGIRCENFTTCWRDGKLFNAIIHKYRPDLIDMNTVAVQSNLANLEHAFYVAEKIGVIRLLDPEDVDVSSPDEKSVITYVSSLYDAFPKVPEGGEGIGANDVEVKWIEYQNMVNYLIQWIRHHVTTMSERTFPNNPVELKALYNQYLQFKETEIPPKETEKSKIKRLYKLLEIWIEFGRIKLLQGYHPNDIEKEWGKLIIAMLEREKALRPEVERLEMLQQIAHRVQRDSVICEDKLILARNALQSDSKRLESGVQFQNEAEIAGYILECENLLRQHVIDVQILIDGKYYQADQLVQRVAKLRDEIMALRNECSSVYSKGRMLTTEQTKLMISGITQSLNSGFAQTLHPSLTSGLTQSLTPSLTSSSMTSGLSSGMTSRLTPSVTPAYTPGFPSGLVPNFSSGVEPNSLQTLKLMQIRKPLLKSSLLDQNLTEEEINMKFVQDLLNWVEEMQVQLDHTEWGSDLPSVESHLENHKNVHRAIEEFESSLKEAKISEIQMTAPLKLTYAEKLHRLESQYAKLLNTSRNQERHLDTLHNFVSRATNELIWLNEKEEEEVAYDWSERNTSIARKKDYHAELMRELDQKEENIKSVQEIAEQLLLENHPARLTIEAYRAAMQTQWSWILQLCQCVEQHIKENTAYFEFFNDAKEATDYLRNLKDAIQRKYSCDRSSSIHKLEDLVQESMEEKEELLQYKSTIASLMGKAKTIIQLKPRNSDCPLKTSIPIKAICDYRQIEITIYKDDECVLANNSHRAKWKVISPTGNEAMVPSVCFTVPPPNKEAVDFANRIEQQYQNVLTLWHESHINMKSVVSWHYLINEIDRIRASNVASIKTMLPGEHQQVLSNLQSRFEDFLEDSQESQIFSGSDITQLEKEVNVCKQYYQELLKSAEREEQEESVYNLYISEVRNIRLRLENCEDRLIRQIRTPLERDDLHESVFRITEQEKLKKELERLKDDLGTITNKCEEFFSQAAASASVPTLRSELNVVLQNMNQVYSMSSTYIDKLKTVNLVLKNTQAAEALVKLYETKLCEEEAVIADKNNIENLISTLKQWRSEVDEKRQVFHALEDELQKAKAISDEMFKTYKERDLDFDWHKEKADQLVERWQNVHVQIDNRLRDLEGIGKSLKYYRDTYHPLDDWIQQVETTQRKIQENQPENSKTLATQLNQQKMLVSEIEMKQSKMDECQKYAEQYSATVKDYELQTMTYRAMVDSQQKSPVKRRRMQSSADLIIQEFMDLRTRYTALVTLMTQYIKFAGDSLKRLEEEEKSLEEEKKEHVEKAKELQKWVSNISKTLKDAEKAGKPPFSMQKISSEEISTKKEQLSEALQAMQLFLAKHGDKMTDEERNELEKQVKTLQESYNLLFSESLKQLQESQTLGDIKVEEKLDKVIAGTIDQTTGEVLSVFQAVLRGLIDYDTGIRLLETQLMISGLISPELRKCFDLKDAKSHGLIDEQILCQLKELNKAKEIISAASPTTIPVLDALAQSMISESMAIKVLEILLSTGSLVIPATGEQLTLQKAFQQNLVSSALFSKVLERQNMCKDLIDPCTSEKVSLIDMVQRSTLQENTGMWLLPVRPQEGGRITLKCGRNLSILRAAHEGLIDRETMFRLLSAQLLSGGLINSNSGQRMTVEEAVREGVIDRDTASSILTYQVQTGGIIQSNPAKRLTVDEAVQCDLITSSSALLVLEAQRGYVGLIWPHSGEIFPASSSLQQELITNELAYKILNSRQKIAALYIPESSQVIGLDAAKQLGIIDNNTASILKNIILPDKMPDLGDLEACKNARRWLSFCKFQPSTVHDYRQEEDVFDGEEPVATQTSEQTKKLFLSYLMINSYMDANTGQRLLLYDGDLDEAVGMLLEGWHAEFDGDTAIKECIDVLSSSGVFLNNASGREKDECTTAPSSFNKCHWGEPEHEETPENRKCAVDEEFHEMGDNVINSEFSQSEKLASAISIDPKVNSSPSVCVPSPISYLTQTELADISMLRSDSKNILTNYENQSQVETNEHASECSHSKNIQNFPGDLIENPVVKSKVNTFCGVNETENEDNTNRDSPIFDYSPRLSALLSHDKLRHRQGSFNDTHTPESNGNKCEAQTLSFSDKTMLSGQRIGEKFQDQFLGIAAINISLPGEQYGQKSLNMISRNPQVQYHNDKYISDTSGEDEKTHPGFQQMPEAKKNESEIEEYSCAVTPVGDTDNAIVSLTSATPLLDGTISAGDYETSLLNDQQNDTGTDTDSDDDFYDTPLFEDDDHDSLLLDGDDRDCLHPEDYDTLQEENDEMASPADAFYDVSKENENSVVPQGALAGSLSVKGKAQCLQDFLMDVEKDELDSGEKIHLNPVGSDKVNGQSLETGSERECTNILEGDESDSLTDYDIVGGKESFTVSLKFDDNGSWRVRKEEYVTVQEFHSDTDHLDSMQSEESYGDYIYDSNDQNDDDNDGIDEEGGCIRDENGKPRCQDVAEDTDIQLCASIVNENSDENKNINKTILLDKMHSCSSLEKQQRVNVVQLASPSENSLATEKSNLPEYTTEIVGKSKENLLNHEMVLKDLLLPIIKDTESEKTFGPASISHNNNISSTSELGNDLANTKVKFIQGSELPELTDSVKGKDQYFKNMAPKIDSSYVLSKEVNHYSPNLETVKEIGLESSTVCASTLPRDEKLKDLCNDFPSHLECISGSKEMASGDSSTEQFSSELQQCLQHTEKMHEYLTLFQDMKPPLDNQESLDNNLEALKNQLRQLETFELGLAPIAVILRKDMKLAEEFLKSLPSDFPRGHLEELSISHQSLKTAFSSLSNVASERMKQIMLAIDSEMSKLAVSHEEFLQKLKSFSDWISEKSRSVKDIEIVNVQDSEYVKKRLEFLKNVLKDLGHTKMQLETTAFDVQFFISEYAQDLSPNQSKQLLRLLNTTQKCFLDVQESVTTQVEHLETQLHLEQDLDDQKIVAERQQEYKEKLQGICDLLTQTENRLIGHQEAFMIGDGTVELKKYQSKQEELQKDMQGSAQALAEVVKNTENFLKENGEKLSREDKALIEQKLNEAKIKCEQLNLKAEQSKKELDKVVTTAIKEETEKVAAVKQLEESKTKIENLLDWLSNVDKDSDRAGMKHKQVIEQNGTHFQEGDGKSAIGEEDEVNGNLLETDVDGQVGPTQENLNQQYQKVKAQHEKIISQHQAVIIATQSAQVLLEKQGQYLSPEEKEKLQKNMKELKAHYETALAESEKKMKLTHSLQEELEKFDADYTEFEHWLQQSEQELENLEAGADDLNGLMTKLKRQKSFSEDVISHKGDLRYITISGNRVLEAAKSCSKRDGGKVDTSATHREVQHKLDHATDRFRSLYSKCNVLGNNLKDLVDKYQHYEDASCGLLSGLQACEATASKHLSEPIAVDPKNLQRQLEETKALQGQISSQQVAVEKLKKTAEVLLDARGSLLPAKNDIQKTLDDIVGRYEDLSKSVNERNEKLQITLTRSLSVQDGLDEMLDWMGSVESSLKEQGQVPLNSAALQDIISKNIMLEQDITGRQSSINAMNEKVKKFMETTDPSTASSLQAKMKDLSARFSEASHKHKETLAKMEELKTKVELFENLSEKVQTFLETKTQALTEVDVPGKDVTELSQYMQESTSEFLEHKKDLEVLHSLLKEISSHGLPSDKALVFEKTNNLSKKFKEMEDTIKEKKEAVTSCQEQLDAFQVLVKSLKSWIKETTKKVPIVQPSFGAEDLGKSLEDTKKLQEKWSLKTSEIQKVNNSGISLCNLISAVTTPAKAIAAVKSGGAMLNGEGTGTNTEEFWANKGLTSIKKDMTDISHDYEDLGLLLKDKIAELNTKLSKLQKAQEESSAMMQWLQKMNKTATKWHQTPAPTDTEAVKTQVEQNKSFEAELKQNVNKVQELKDKLTELLEENPDTPEAPRWKQMLTEIDSKWQELNQLTIDRQQKLEESSNNLTQFQTVEAQLKQWLVEKELMVSVLGPLSIDPNMLNTQRQQVQILLQEFATRKPQYEQLTAAGQGILSRPGEDPSLHGIVKEQLAAVTQKWDSLTGQLSDRCDWIDQAIVKSTQYQSLLRSLSDKLSDLDNKLSSSLAVSTHPDAMNQQLETAQKMKQEIQQEKKQIKVAQALCEDLSALVKEEYLKAELSRQLEGILKSFKDIEQKAESHVQHLQSACASSHQFQQMSRDFQAWLDTKKEEQNKSHPISAKLNVLESLIKDHKDFSKTLTAQSHIYEKTIAEGENLLLKTQGSEKAALQLQLNTIKTNWDTFNKEVKERENKLKDSLEKALKYKEQVETLRPWIDKCQNNLEEIKFCLDPAEGENSIAKLKSLQKEMDQHFGMVELLNNTANSLLSVCEIDKEVVTDENKSLIQKVDMVTEQLHSKKFSLENMAQKFKEFQEVSKESKRQLHCAKEQLDIHDSLGPQAYSNKYLTMLQTQQKSLQALKHQVDLAKRLAQDLVVEASDSKGTSDVLLQVETIAQEHSALSQQVDEKCSFLETKLQGIGHFQNTIREMFSQFAEFDDELDSMAPVGRDAETLQKQKETIKAFLKKLGALIASNDNANKTCKMMLATEETSPDLVGIKRDLEALSKQCNKLLDRAQAREEQVEGTIKRLEEFYSKLKEFSTLLQKAEEHEESQGPVGMETETINQQLEVFKVFQKEEIEPLQGKQQDVNWLGQGLIQSAAKSTSTQGLEHDLDDVNARWKTLNKKVAQRAAQLQEALLHCGRFQDALESLLSWMVDTEELVANQKPPSAEFKVVKAQIQEQKLLQRLLDDRKSTVEVIKREGEKIATTAEPADKVKILKQLSLLDSRWEALLNKAETRNRQLEGISVVAQQFHETLEPLNEWLTTIEKRLVNCEPIGTQASKLEKQISQHKVLQEDILLRKQNVDQALLNGLELLKQTTGDEVLIIQDKLEAIKARYKDITKLSTDVAKTLEQALQLARRLHSTHEELCTWLDKVEVELLSYETQVLKGEAASQAQVRQKELKKEAKNNKALLDSLNEVSSALLELVPWRAREGLEKMVAEDNERYRLVSDTITQKVEEIDAAILRSQQFDQAADAELSWITETEKKLMSLGDIRLEQEQTSAQLQVQKTFTMEILRHKDIIDELVKSGHKIMTTCSEEEKQSMKKKLDKVLKNYDTICQINSERYLQLERAQSLVNQFWETYEELWPWLTETQSIISQLPAPALEYETLRQQQEEHRQLRELIAEHKPHIDKMNKTGPQLLELSPGEGFSIQEKYVAADTLYSQIKEDVKKRAVALDEAISQSTQFHDKIDQILESLERIVERLRQPPSISAEVEKIKEQISENKNVSVDMEKLQPLYETLKQRGEEMIARSGGTDKDISAKAVQDKLDQMVFIWENIHTLVEEREAKLLDVMELAEKFWCDHMSLVVTIKDTQDFIRDLEDPGIDPSVVKQQQEAAEAIREEIDGLQEELDIVINLGSELIAACGEPDKPIVKKSIDELNSAWDSLNKAWKDRIDKLEEAMQAAVQYQDGLQAVFDWVDIAGGKLASMSPIGTDLETVKQQIEELKQFKSEAYQQQIEMERLNHQAELLLKKVTEESDKHTVQDPLMELKLIWDSLEERIINRQHKLEGALLALGQFQHALDELLTWLTHTEGLLSEQKPVGGDPKAIEIELAKHHVLQNDVLAHQSTVEAVNKAGNDLIESSAGEEASNLQNKLQVLNQRWQNVLEKTEQRKQQLDGALRQAKGFHGEIEDLQQWLTDTERHLLASKPLGGLPETAKEQLNVHMEVCAAFEAKEETYKSLMQKGQQMLARCPKSAETNIDQDINNLKEKWESVETKLNERKTKLEEALNLAMEFHNSLQDFISWLTQAEQTLNVASRPSLILDTVLFQIDEHKVFANEVNSHREQIIELDKTGTHLKYFSQKQDVVLIKNLLISVQSRWEKVVQRLVERGRSLDDARKRAKQFHEAWSKLMEWLEESEKSLDSELEIANDPDKIKTQLAQHKEFQKSLGAKHSVYDTTNRTGRSLKEKTSLADDNLKLDDMLSELRDKWDTICGKSVERQNKLEEALLFSGQFTDALQALIDWLYRVEPQLAEDQPVHGDIDLVMNLIDNHKAFQKELGKRTSSVQALKRSARELIEGSRDDSSWVKVQMQELSTRWETVCALSISKQTRLEAALRQAEEFHSVVHALLEWLAEAEQTLRFHGVLPDDEDALRTLIDQHKEFMKKLEEKRAELNKATTMGDTVLAICHPDSITTIKHWITIIRARFEEVLAWAKQHQQRLASALAGLIAKQELLEALLAWLQWAETTLTDKDKEVIPQEIEEVKALIAEHQTFMEEMTRKQPDVDKVTKTYKRRAADPSSLQSHIPVLDKGRAGRKRFPASSLYPSGSQTQIETKNPRVNLLVSKWQQVWLLALERRRKLNDALDRLEELREFANFDFDIWRKKYMRWMNHKKSRVMDFFRRIDKDQDGKITRQEFIDGILSSKFPTSRLEMSAVADIFDRDGDGYIDYYEFVAALHPNKDAYKPITDADKIEDEVTRQVAKCKCAKRFQVEQIGDNKYRVSFQNNFGDSQQLRLVRILRSTVMVRVGGGWMALDEFLVKNDPCRVHHHGSKMLRSESNSSITTTQPTIAKGRTNMELREKFILADGASQGMAAFRPRGRRSRPSSRGASPNRSTSVSSQAAQAATPQVPATTTPKGTPIQGSKLRLPGYLSGKGFHSGEDSGLITTAAARVRTQFADSKKTPSRPGSRAGSKAGSRASSRRGSDASDFDISEIQSVCSDVETVPQTHRPTPRAGSRPSTAKPSKIPTPQRKSPASKLDKSSKR